MIWTNRSREDDAPPPDGRTLAEALEDLAYRLIDKGWSEGAAHVRKAQAVVERTRTGGGPCVDTPIARP